MESKYITERVHNVFANRCAFCSKKTYKKKNTIHNNYQLYTYVKQDQMSTILGWFFGSKHFWFNRGKKNGRTKNLKQYIVRSIHIFLAKRKMEFLKLSVQALQSCTLWFCLGDDHSNSKGYTEQPTLPQNHQRTLWFPFNFFYTFWFSWSYCNWGCLCASTMAWDTPGNVYSIKNILDWETRRTQVSLTACIDSFTSRLMGKGAHNAPAKSEPCPSSVVLWVLLAWSGSAPRGLSCLFLVCCFEMHQGISHYSPEVCTLLLSVWSLTWALKLFL